MKSVRVLGVVVAAMLALAGCGSEEPAAERQSTGSGSGSGAAQSQQQGQDQMSDASDDQSDGGSDGSGGTDGSGSSGKSMNGSEDDAEKSMGDAEGEGDRMAPVAEQLRFDAETLTGEPLAGADLVGKPTVLWFWAPWCPVCQREADGIGTAADENPDVRFVGVAAQDEEPAMRDFVDTYGLEDFQHIADLDAEVWGKFGIDYQPAFAFVDADGKVDVHRGTLSEDALQQRLDQLGRS